MHMCLYVHTCVYMWKLHIQYMHLVNRNVCVCEGECARMHVHTCIYICVCVFAQTLVTNSLVVAFWFSLSSSLLFPRRRSC